jgi:hypothetical protein
MRCPEHPFPAPLDDCIAAVRWAASEGSSLGIDPQRIAVIGDSSGANLALGVCLALRDAGARIVRGAALLYGAYSLDLDMPSARAYGGGPYFLGVADMERYANDYLPTKADRQNPLAVPMLANLADLPPLYVAVANSIRCIYDPERPAARAAAASASQHGAAHLKCAGVLPPPALLRAGSTTWGPEVDRVGEFRVSHAHWRQVKSLRALIVVAAIVVPFRAREVVARMKATARPLLPQRNRGGFVRGWTRVRIAPRPSGRYGSRRSHPFVSPGNGNPPVRLGRGAA